MPFIPGNLHPAVSLISFGKIRLQVFDDAVQYSYFKNFSNTVSASQNNNLSLKIIYFLDYLNIRSEKQELGDNC
jgi:hypothetical protein